MNRVTQLEKMHTLDMGIPSLGTHSLHLLLLLMAAVS